MRRVLVIGLLLGLMYVLPYLQVESDAQIDPMSLAAVGFILLAAFTLGELTNSIKFPRITGYILAGVLFGPHVVNLYSNGVVQDLTLINALAIGLIALTAGGEMKIEGLRRVAKSLSLILLIKCGIILLAVTAAVWALRPWIPFLSGASLPLVLSVGFIFGVLAMGTSPAVTIAVINETRSRGRLSDLLLGVAVAKDVVMVVLLAIAISLTNLFLSPDAVFKIDVLLRVGEELLFSILAGVIVGGTVIAYIRFVKAEMWLFVIGLVFLGSTVATALHLEALLMFITAGFVVQNFSPYGEKFIHPIENVALPVYVVFFSIAGAGLDLGALVQVGLVALILVVTRLVAIYTGTRIATGLAREPFEIRDNAWMGFIPQAGVVLGLAIIVSEFVSIGPQIRPIVMASLAMNLAIGPITLKLALGRAGETASATPAPEQAEETSSLPAPSIARKEVTQLEDRLQIPEFPSPQLTQATETVRERLISIEQDFFDSVVTPFNQDLRSFSEDILKGVQGETKRFREELDALESDSPDVLVSMVRGHRAACFSALASRLISFASREKRLENARTAFESLLDLVQRVQEAGPSKMEVDQEKARLESQPGDNFLVRAVKRWKRLASSLSLSLTKRPLQRVVPFSALVKFHFAGRFPTAALGAGNLLGSQSIFTLKRIHSLVDKIDQDFDTIGENLSAENVERADALRDLDAFESTISEEVAAFGNDLEGRGTDLRRAVIEAMALCFDEFNEHLALAGTFELPPRKYRFSRLFKASREARQSIGAHFQTWRNCEVGLAGSAAKHLEVLSLSDQVSLEIDRRLLQPRDRRRAEWDETLGTSIRQCGESLEKLQSVWSRKKGADELLATAVRDEQARVEAAVEQAIGFLQESRRELAAGGVLEVLVPAFGQLSDALPETYQVADPKDRSRIRLDGSGPRDLRLKTAPIRAVARTHLEVKMARRLAEVDRLNLEGLDLAIESVGDTERLIKFNFKTASDQLGDAPDAEAAAKVESILTGSLERAVMQLRSTHDRLSKLSDETRSQVKELVEQERGQLEQAILEKSTFDLKVHLVHEDAVGKGSAALAHWIRSSRLRAAVVFRRFKPLGREVVEDLKSTLGLSRYSPTEIASFCDATAPERLSPAHLPFIYRKLFDVMPLEAAEFLMAREEEMRLVEEALGRWTNGMKCSVAVIGELGSGKTSFINVAVEEMASEYTIHRINFERTCYQERELCREIGRVLGFPGTTDFERLRLQIEGLPGRHIVVLEDAHKLFLRSMGGFDGLKKLLLLVAQTNQKIFWVLSLREYSWRYLNSPVNLSDFFTFVINMENMSRQEIEEVIMARHRLSGFDLEFRPDRYTMERRKYRRASREEQQKLLRAEYFTQLSRDSEGNILAAIFSWLASIQEVRGNVLVIKPFKKMRFDFLRKMEVDELLTLGMVIQHGNLSPAEHVSIFGGTVEDSLSTMTCLTNINLMVQSQDENGTPHFAINKVVYKRLSKELRERNILH